MRYQEIMEAKAPVSSLLVLLKRIALVCDSPNPTVKNTQMNRYGVSYTAGIRDNGSKYNGATSLLKGLGFADKHMQGTGGSSHGDFSSDRYGETYVHPNGMRVSVSANFGYGKPTFNISIDGTEEQAAEVLNPSEVKPEVTSDQHNG